MLENSFKLIKKYITVLLDILIRLVGKIHVLETFILIFNFCWIISGKWVVNLQLDQRILLRVLNRLELLHLISLRLHGYCDIAEE